MEKKSYCFFLFLAALGLFCAWTFSSCGHGATPSHSMRASLGSGLSCCGAWAFRLLGSVENILKIFFLMHEYRIYIFFLFSIYQCLQFSDYRSFMSLVKFISSFFSLNYEWDCFLILLDGLLFTYRNKIDLCVFHFTF